MRHKSEIAVIVAVAAFALIGIFSVNALQHRFDHVPYTVEMTVDPVQADPVVQADPADAGAWFQSFRGHCNPVEVETRLRFEPAPRNEHGRMYTAACFALAGKIDLARAEIDALPQERRYHAAGVVFNIGHPAADAGDELASAFDTEMVEVVSLQEALGR